MKRAALAVLTVASVLALAGCSEAVLGQARPVPADLAGPSASTTPPTPSIIRPPSTTTPSGLVATAGDLPALVTVVEAVFDAIAVRDFRGACASFELGEDPPSAPTLALCGAGLQAGINSTAGELSPEEQAAGLATLGSLSVDTALVQLDGPNALVPDAAIISSLVPDRSFYGSDLFLVLTDGGWKVDPAAFE